MLSTKIILDLEDELEYDKGNSILGLLTKFRPAL